MELEHFEYIKEKHGYHASWAVWGNEGIRPKDGVGDLSVLDPSKNAELLTTLNPNVVLVALNISGKIQTPLGNFHSSSGNAQDYKLRYALRGTSAWGGYLTDIIKDFEERISTKIKPYLRENPDFLRENLASFEHEIDDLGVENPLIVALGGDAHSILIDHFSSRFRVMKLKHYSHYISKEMYRAEALDKLPPRI